MLLDTSVLDWLVQNLWMAFIGMVVLIGLILITARPLVRSRRGRSKEGWSDGGPGRDAPPG